MSKGVIYIAYTNIKYINEAIFSAKSLKKSNPSISITIITDHKLNNDCFDKVLLYPPERFRGVRCKQDFINESPYDLTVMLDTDTYINDDISDLFDILKRFDIALAHDYARKRIINENSRHLPGGYYFSSHKEYSEIPYCFPEFNTGVIVYKKCDKITKFFKSWAKKYREMQQLTPYDQPSFRVSLWQSDLKIHSLPIEYNCRAKKIKDKNINYRNLGVFQKNHLIPRIYHWHDISKLKNINEINSMAQNF
jgi:hypothetical protein